MKRSARLLFSLIVLGQAARGQTGPGWVTMIDAREHAFSIDIPRGWKAHGGMFRSNPVDARPFVDMTSPDGRSNIRIGDPTIPSYDIPNATLERLHSIGKFIAPYASGEEFALKYGQSRFPGMCHNLRVYKTGESEPTWGRGTGTIRITAGWAGFTCIRNGEQTGAYVYSETLEVMPTFGSAGHWYIITLGSAISPLAQGKAVGELLLHSYKSLALNPAWMRNQGQIISAARQGVLQSAAQVQQIYDNASRSYRQSMQMQAQQSANFNDVLLGQTYTRNAAGQTFTVPSGSGGQLWHDAVGTVKESAMVPGPAFEPLTPISR